MPLFKYKTVNDKGVEAEGTIDAVTIDVAINSLQRRGLVVASIHPSDDGGSFLSRDIGLFQSIKNKDVVILSRQMATLFSSQVSALRIFKLLSSEDENPALRKVLAEVADDIQGGSTISTALARHPKAFSIFYVNMVRAGEESGKLDETFQALAEYLDRSYEVAMKVKNALIYPAFVITTFIAVMALMMTVVIPKIGQILKDSHQAIPAYTQVVLGISDFLVNYGWFFLVAVVIGLFILVSYLRTPSGKSSMARVKITFPYIGNLYKKLYLSRIADNMNTMLSSGIPMIKSLELTSDVVDNDIYRDVILKTVEDTRAGLSLSDAFSKHEEMPNIIVQMTKVGEETGNLGDILKNLAKFYQREVSNAVDTLVGLIEPLMIVMLGLGVGFLLASVLIPIYNVSSNI
ncbi:MAG: type II secretion system F family protein [bacterium]